MDEYYTKYYSQQTGGGVANYEFSPIHMPRVYQRGRGVGSIFSSLWRFLQPLLKTGATYASKELLETGSDILNGIINQKPLNNVLADRSIKIVDQIRDKTAEKIKKMAGAGRKRRRCDNKQHLSKKAIMKKEHFVGFRHPEKSKNNLVKRKNKINNSKNTERVLDIFHK